MLVFCDQLGLQFSSGHHPAAGLLAWWLGGVLMYEDLVYQGSVWVSGLTLFVGCLRLCLWEIYVCFAQDGYSGNGW